MRNRQQEETEERPRVLPFSTDKRLGLCFGCGRNNPSGLRLSFRWDGKIAQAEFTPSRFHQSWPGIVHGGIIVTLLDEAMGYATLFGGVSDFLTATIQVNLKRPALVGEFLNITGWIAGRGKRSVKVAATVTLPDGTLVAEGKGTQVLIDIPGENSGRKEAKSQVGDLG
jgi:acyl-coenzyme A thioesterase PaaI-like protein